MYYVEVLREDRKIRFHVDRFDQAEDVLIQLIVMGYVCDAGFATDEEALRDECPPAVRNHYLDRIIAPGLRK